MNQFLSPTTSAGGALRKVHATKLWKNRLPAISCGLTLLLYAGVGGAEDNIDAKSFHCITEMAQVRQFYVDNLLGNLDATLVVANSATGGTYPAGSVIQLIPGEAMVKREQGSNSATHDWEFFQLDVSKDGTKIQKRGLPKWPIPLEAASAATFKLGRSGISSAKWTTVALQFRSPAP